MEYESVRSDPDGQAARGLTPDEQRAERERESRESTETKFELLPEQTEAEEVAQRVGQPLEPRYD